jgi:hypothetical protein
MVLTAMPCTDTHTAENNLNSIEFSGQSHTQANDLDLCSPFCFCHCCQTLSFPSIYDSFLSDVEMVALNTYFRESRFSSPFSSIWQPPKI